MSIDTSLPLLLPHPRHIELTGPLAPARPPTVSLDPSLHPEGYRLTVADGTAELVAADEAGAFYGRATLAQLVRLHDGQVPGCSIIDWPDLAVRAVMLDISRDKVPTTETLEVLIDRLASWKVNQVQLYMEHTFAYQGHEEVWAGASPLTAEEVRSLDAYCRARHVELVPNQNCLAHMERWLRHPRYHGLAAAPNGTGGRKYPTTLEPNNPESLALVRQILAELVACFTSSRVHIGLDEPWDLPADRFDDYLRWAQTLRSVPELDGRDALMWGDFVALVPQRLAELPDAMTVCEWGYDAGHPFPERTTALSEARVGFWVAPGTSSWLTLIGRTPNMVANCQEAMDAALEQGASGLLNTDWGDMGHLQYLPISEPGFAYGAAVSWCLEANRDLDLPAALSAHAFDDPSGELGAALMELGSVYLAIEPQFPNISTLVMHLYFPQLQLGNAFTKGIAPDQVERAEALLDSAVQRLGRAVPRRADGHLVIEELRTGADLVRLACQDAQARLRVDGLLASVPAARDALAEELSGLITRHRELWLARNRPGGLKDSLAWLQNLERSYRTGAPQQDWGSM